MRASVAQLQQQSERLEKAFVSGGQQVNLSGLERKYTMESERRVYAETLARHVDAPPVQAIELWGDENPVAEQHAEQAAAAAGEFGDGRSCSEWGGAVEWSGAVLRFTSVRQ